MPLSWLVWLSLALPSWNHCTEVWQAMPSKCLSGTSKYYKYYLIYVSFIWCLTSDPWIWNWCCCGCHAAAQSFKGFPAQPFFHDSTFLHTLSSSCVFSKPADTFCRGHIAVLLLLWRRMWTALPTPPVALEPHLSPAWGPTTPALQECQPPAVSSPQDGILAWPQHIPVPREFPVPRAGAAPSCAIPWLESWGCALPAPTASASQGAVGPHWHSGATIAW